MKTILSLFIALLLVGCAHVQPTSLNVTYRIHGTIDYHVLKDFYEFLRKHDSSHIKTFTLVLDSPGGNVDFTKQIIKNLNRMKSVDGTTVITRVEKYSFCASACTVLFTVGDQRLAHARSFWTFHSPFFKHPGYDPSLDFELTPGTLRWMSNKISKTRQYIHSQYKQADPNFAEYLEEHVLYNYSNEYRLHAEDIEEKFPQFLELIK